MPRPSLSWRECRADNDTPFPGNLDEIRVNLASKRQPAMHAFCRHIIAKPQQSLYHIRQQEEEIAFQRFYRDGFKWLGHQVLEFYVDRQVWKVYFKHLPRDKRPKFPWKDWTQEMCPQGREHSEKYTNWRARRPKSTRGSKVTSDTETTKQNDSQNEQPGIKQPDASAAQDLSSVCSTILATVTRIETLHKTAKNMDGQPFPTEKEKANLKLLPVANTISTAAQAQVVQLRREVHEANKRVEDATKRVSELESAVKVANDAIGPKNDKIHELRQRIADQAKEIRWLKREFTAMEGAPNSPSRGRGCRQDPRPNKRPCERLDRQPAPRYGSNGNGNWTDVNPDSGVVTQRGQENCMEAVGQILPPGIRSAP